MGRREGAGGGEGEGGEQRRVVMWRRRSVRRGKEEGREVMVEEGEREAGGC